MAGDTQSAVLDADHLGGAAVDQPEGLVVAGPADAVPGAQLDALHLVDLAAAPASGDLARLPAYGSFRAAPEQHLAAVSVDPEDTPLVPFLDTDPLVRTVERHDIALALRGKTPLGHPGVAGEEPPQRLRFDFGLRRERLRRRGRGREPHHAVVTRLGLDGIDDAKVEEISAKRCTTRDSRGQLRIDGSRPGTYRLVA